MGKLYFNPVVMAGGVGSRLWPLSRKAYPKQYQKLVHHSDSNDNYSMLQQTCLRLKGLNVGLMQLICNEDHRFLAAEQMRCLGPVDILLEPVGRNTAPAIVVAALRLSEAGRDEPMLILSADHDISKLDVFEAAVKSAHSLAESGHLVTLGITPSFACTGYGYIQMGKPIQGGFDVYAFVEKPVEAAAKMYLESGEYLWNSGMFIVKPSVMLAEAAKWCPSLLDQCKAIVTGAKFDLDFIRLPRKAFELCESISIDYAVMEKTSNAAVVPMDCGWSDVGDFQSMWQVNQKDTSGNVIDGDVITMNTKNCLLKTENRLVAVSGIENVAVIDTKDAVLVTKLDQAQEVKQLVEQLHGRAELDHQREVYRPWGSYDSIDRGPNYQVKRIIVNPNSRLSLQRHAHRAEHWVVVQGEAKVHLDGQDYLLKTNDSIYIPKGAVHCLANETAEKLYLVEVQSGSYLGEDDIERLDDAYGRY